MNFNKIMSIIALLCCACCAGAEIINHKNTYIGIDTIRQNLRFRNGFGEKIFSKKSQAYNFYAGLEFSNNLGLELGYEIQPNIVKQSLLVEGDRRPGYEILEHGDADHIKAEYKSKNLYCGLTYKYVTSIPLGLNTLKFQGLFGFSRSRFKARQSRLSYFFEGEGHIINDDVHLFSQTRIIPTIKLSAIAQLTSNLGCRLSLNYRNTRKFSIASDVYTIKPANSYGLGVGLVYYFR